MFGVFLAQKLCGKPLTIVGDGTQTRDFTYVFDGVNSFMAATHSDCRNEISNVAAGRPTSMNRIAELLGGERVFIPKRPGEPDITHADLSKITRDLRWEPKISIEEGVGNLLKNSDDF